LFNIDHGDSDEDQCRAKGCAAEAAERLSTKGHDVFAQIAPA
jgi:hypothetical protein